MTAQVTFELPNTVGIEHNKTTGKVKRTHKNMRVLYGVARPGKTARMKAKGHVSRAPKSHGQAASA